MNIPISIKSCNITEQGNAEGIIEFNNIEFHYVIVPPVHEDEKFDITVKEIDLDNLQKAGFNIDLTPLIDEFAKAVDLHEETKQKNKPAPRKTRRQKL